MKTRNGSPDAALSVESLEEPECPQCLGACFVTRRVDVSDPAFGVAFPCPRCVDVGAVAREQRKSLCGLPTKNAKTFDDFCPRNGTGQAAETMRKFPNGTRSMVTLSGPNGTGKTHLMEALGWRLLAEDVGVRYAFVPDLLDQLRASYAGDSGETAQAILGRCQTAEVLLLDDIMELRVTEFAAEQIIRLVDDRYRNGTPLVVSTNLTLDLMDRVWGSRLADRLFDDRSVDVVYLRCASYRTGTLWQPPQTRR